MQILRKPPTKPEELRKYIDERSSVEKFTHLIELQYQKSPRSDLKLVTKALHLNAKWFSGMVRDSGPNYLEGHLIPTALLLMWYGITHPVIVAAALSHDSIEDINGVDEKLISEELSYETAFFVEGVTKPPLYGRDKHSMVFELETIDKIRGHGKWCVALKLLGDRLDNILDLHGSWEKRDAKLIETVRHYLDLGREFKLPIHDLELAINEQRRELNQLMKI